MAAVGDVYQLKHFTNTLAGQQSMVNVYWYYLSSLGTASAGDDLSDCLSQAFEDLVIDDWRNLVTSSIQTDRLEIVNYRLVTDFFVGLNGGLSKPIVGTRTPETLPLFVTASFRYNRAGPGSRNGYKRISGLAEGDVNGWNFTSGFIPFTVAFAAAMDLTLYDNTFTANWQPVVPMGIKTLGTNPGFMYPSGCSVAGVGSQVSRKQAFDT